MAKNVGGKPLVSIVTPIYDCEKFIALTIESIVDQTFQNWELIIVDDCSKDSSLNIVQSYADRDHRIRVLRLEKNSGAAVARNTAIEAARGRYIAFLDSDDTWLPYKLERQLSFMEKFSVAFCYSSYHKVNEKGDSLGIAEVPPKIDYYGLLKSPRIGCLTAIYDTRDLGKVYMPLIRKRQDFGLWLRIVKKVGFAYGIQEPLATYLVRSNSISANKSSAAKYTWRLYRDVEGLGLIKSLYYFCNYAFRNGLRSKMPRLAKLLSL